MTATATHQTPQAGGPVGERVELARYAISSGERILYGQRVNGVVRVTDVPASGRARSYLVERELEQDGYDALQALVADYLVQSKELGAIPMSTSLLSFGCSELSEDAAR